jgi:hypothetical protein
MLGVMSMTLFRDENTMFNQLRASRDRHEKRRNVCDGPRAHCLVMCFTIKAF